jgi:DNA modification methylase
MRKKLGWQRHLHHNSQWWFLMANPADKVQKWAIEKLIPYARNARTHSDEQVAQIAASIKEWGWTTPVLVDEDGGIIAGHGRTLAAQRLKMTEVPVMVAKGWSDAKKRAYVIADNRLALNAGWDNDMLALELAEIKELGFDLDLTGFAADEIAALMPVEIEPGKTDEDAVPEVPEQPVTVLGDVWILGKHRLMCGDSTSIDAVDTLMAGGKADMVFTDPPYNVAMQRSAKIKNDDISDEDFESLLSEAFSCANINAKDESPWFVWIGWRAWSTCERVLSNYKKVRNCIVWAKPSIGLGQPGYRYQHEIGLFCGKVDDRSISDLWSFPRDHAGLHPTMKPVELVEHGLNTAGKRGDVVLDLFGGSGSTLIACEKTNRQARLMELDPRYVDVIIKRWQDYTGKIATHAETGKPFAEVTNGNKN